MGEGGSFLPFFWKRGVSRKSSKGEKSRERNVLIRPQSGIKLGLDTSFMAHAWFLSTLQNKTMTIAYAPILLNL